MAIIVFSMTTTITNSIISQIKNEYGLFIVSSKKPKSKALNIILNVETKLLKNVVYCPTLDIIA